MEIKVPNLTPVAEAIDSLPVKPQHFFAVGLTLAVVAAVDHPSSLGLGVAAAASMLAAAWLQSITLRAFLKRAAAAAAAPEPATSPAPSPVAAPAPSALAAPPHDPIDLEPPRTQ
jgi:hypothetical protein